MRQEKRVDELRPGEEFVCVQGKLWTFIRQHGANSGAYIVKGEDGRYDCFAGCAVVTVEEVKT